MSANTTTTKPDFKIAIVGGGLSGVALALGLLKRNIRVDLYEKHAQFEEYGAGLAFHHNAVIAMQMLDDSVYQAFKEVASIPSTAKTYEVVDGFESPSKGGFDVLENGETGGVHRSHFLNAMAERLPKGDWIHFGKSLDDVHEDTESGKVTMTFADASTAEADIVIGADGIGSHVRRVMFGKQHPCVRAGYSGQYTYRTLVPMERAVAAVGEKRAYQPTMFLGPSGLIITYPIDQGKALTLAAVYDNGKPWANPHGLTAHGTKQDFQNDFSNWKGDIRGLIDSADNAIDIYGVFDTADNPVPYYAQGRMALIGDAAHATSPNLASGAGFAIEDAAILAELLADVAVRDHSSLSTALSVYSAVRVPRGKFLIANSRRAAKVYTYMDEEVGNDFAKIEPFVKQLFTAAWHADPARMAEEAKTQLRERLGA